MTALDPATVADNARRAAASYRGTATGGDHDPSDEQVAAVLDQCADVIDLLMKYPLICIHGTNTFMGDQK
jgi:hypothetical protein